MSVHIEELEFVTVEPPTFDADAPGTTVWSDGAGKHVAYGVTRGEWHWLRIFGAGAYSFRTRPHGRTVACSVVPEAGVGQRVIIDSYYRTVVPLALQAYGYEILHGSGVALSRGVVALCADRETGKSTIAFAMRRRGHAVVADDAVVLSMPGDDAAAAVGVHTLPFELRLREPTVDHFGLTDTGPVWVGNATARQSHGALSLAAIVILSRDDRAEAVHLEPMPSTEAFSSVLAHAHAYSLLDAERKRVMMQNYLRLATLVPAYRLVYPTGLLHLDAICDRLESIA